jgi:chromosome segregation ATPase
MTDIDEVSSQSQSTFDIERGLGFVCDLKPIRIVDQNGKEKYGFTMINNLSEIKNIRTAELSCNLVRAIQEIAIHLVRKGSSPSPSESEFINTQVDVLNEHIHELEKVIQENDNESRTTIGSTQHKIDSELKTIKDELKKFKLKKFRQVDTRLLSLSTDLNSLLTRQDSTDDILKKVSHENKKIRKEHVTVTKSLTNQQSEMMETYRKIDGSVDDISSLRTRLNKMETEYSKIVEDNHTLFDMYEELETAMIKINKTVDKFSRRMGHLEELQNLLEAVESKFVKKDGTL